MDTSSLTKETNVMSQADLDKLRENYSFPSRVQLRILGEGETILSVRQGEARPEKNLLRGSPSNVKGWKKRFFLPPGMSGSSFPSLPTGDGIPRVPRKCCNKLPALTEVEAKRTAEVLGKVGPRGYFDMLKVLGSRTFNKHFPVGCMEISSSGGGNVTSGDEGEFLGNFQYGSSSEESLEYLGAIIGDVGRIARKAFLGIPDETLLRWLRGKVKDSFTNLFPRGSNSSSNSRSESLSDFELPLDLRFDGRRKSEGDTTALERVVIQEKHPLEGGQASKKGKLDSSKGKEVMPLPPPKRVLNGVIPSMDKKKVDQLSENELINKSFHALGQIARADSAELELVKAQNRALKAEGRLIELGEQAARSSAELDKSEVVARLEAEVADLTSKLVQAKKLAIEEFKIFEDFKIAITDSAATYFSEGFKFYKRQLLH
ncbi:hypothetical protein Acr_28g0014840 [Actinidia rufa]|uniref:Uncharacterized protein n=1 Tax=Actinidia rufa TaxID=165716 RepID=A0A7J0HCJ0_9ERIC|nr:hypothetical protein Acr_28g0014840 [Actinidia rufa]